MTEQKRAQYRIQYTRAQCPILKLSRAEFDVVDLSEDGLRFSLDGLSGITVGQKIGGSLKFRDGSHSLIHGTVHRIDGTLVSLTLTQPISLSKIMEEQRVLIAESKKTAP